MSEPNVEQMITCYLMCCRLTEMFRAIQLVRYDERIDSIYILAGEELGFIIDSRGVWRVDQ